MDKIRFQKIAGLINEDEDFDLSFNPLNVTVKASFEEIVNSSTFESVMDDDHWNYDRFGFGDVRNRCYVVFLEGTESEEDVMLLKKGLTSEKVIEEGIDKGYFFYDTGGLYFKVDREDEMQNWLYSLEDESSINEEEDFDLSENSLTKLERIETRRKVQINTDGAFKIVYDYEKNPDKIVKMFPQHLKVSVKKEYQGALKYPDLFAKVYKVNFDKNYIIQQKLDTKKAKDELSEFGDHYDMLRSEVLDYFENVVRDPKETKEVIDEFNKVNPELGKKVKKWLEFTKKVTELNIDKLIDYNPGNMGYDDKGNLRLLDI